MGRGERKRKRKRRRRVEEKSKKRNFGERSLVGLSLFQAFAMEKDSGGDQEIQLQAMKGEKIFSRK